MQDNQPSQPADDKSEPPPTPSSRPRPPRIPPPDPKAAEKDKVFATAHGPDVPLVVTVSDGDVTKWYAPTELVSKVSHAVNSVVSSMSGTGYDSMFYGALAGNSMRMFFGDPQVFAASPERIHLSFVYDESLRVAELIEIDDEDEFFSRAVAIGKPAEKYGELAHLVHSEQITMKWEPRGQAPRILTPERAGRQHSRLARPGETVSHPITINGTLYRAITEPSKGEGRGTVGIKLHAWSAAPPGTKRGSKVRAITYTSPEVEARVKNGLLGEPVEARLSIRTSRIGTTVDPNAFDLVLDEIYPGPADSRQHGGPDLFEESEAPSVVVREDDADEHGAA